MKNLLFIFGSVMIIFGCNQRTPQQNEMSKAEATSFSFVSAKNNITHSDISIAEYQSHLEFLADDLLQGRLPGSAGGDIAALYIASHFKRCGLQAISAEDKYFQHVPIRYISPDYNSVEFVIHGNGTRKKMKPFDEVLVSSCENKRSVEFKGQLVFTGYGIEFPEYGWDDFKGVDVKGKILVSIMGQPDFISQDHNSIVSTNYGRREYKTKTAFDKGAKGILFIHGKSISARSKSPVPWPALQVGYSRSTYGNGFLQSPLPLISVITEDSFDQMLKHEGFTTRDLVEKANNKDFSPIALNLSIETRFNQTITEFTSPNVIGVAPGYENPEEAIIYMAHYDHLGIGKPVDGDSIYNGAVDNASGTAALLTLASYFSQHPTKRSVIFLATTREESGFLGAQHYLKYPVIPIDNMILGLNMDMMSFFGKGKSTLSNMWYSDVSEIQKEIANKMVPGKELFTQIPYVILLESYPFALHDVVTLDACVLFWPESETDSISVTKAVDYRTPKDEVKSWFRYDDIILDLEILKQVGTYYATDGIKPKYTKGNPYEPAKALWMGKMETSSNIQ
jgi:hypothetical protein